MKQKNENIVEYRGIGAVKYVKNNRARNISIRIQPSGDIRVTIPRYVSRKRAEMFLLSKEEWILRKLGAMAREDSGNRIPDAGEIVLIRQKPVKIELSDGDSGPEDTLWRLLLGEAKSYLPQRVQFLAALHGFTYSRVRIRRMRSRWGSCNHHQGINLNSWLMMLPDHLSDYVILHELVHTRHPHHGPEFWNALDEVTGGNSKKLRKELRGRKIMSIYPENQFSREGD
ncbi:MAG: M48 family metallopeptidase [Bacteroidales bacterium]